MSDKNAIGGYKHPVRQVNQDILSRLTLEDTKVYPLPGAVGPRPAGVVDPRLTKLNPSTIGPLGETTCFYEHVATVRYHFENKDLFFVAFRQTMDALLAEQSDPEKYPEWLMKDPVKKTELRTHIYVVTRHWKQIPALRSFEDWLAHIEDPMMFDTIAYFLLSKNIISQEMYGKIK